MQIKSVACDQFAGIQKREFKFKNGLNIIIGENESGKSTIVDLIYHLLFKNTKLDKRIDDDFINTYFPKTLSGPQGDVIDGTLQFETENGTFKLQKEWEKGSGSCRLTLPNGTSIKIPTTITQTLNDELKYGAGVYGEIIFPSQKRQQLAIESILKELPKKSNALTKTRENLTSTLTLAALETGGVSLEKLEKSIEEKISNLNSRWDFLADMPEKGVKHGIHSRWKNDVGLILEAYYAMNEIREAQADAKQAEEKVEAHKADIQDLMIKKKTIENKKAEFQKFINILEQLLLLKDTLQKLSKEKKEAESVLDKWPILKTNIMQAIELQNKLSQAKIHDLFLEAKEKQKIFEKKKITFENLITINPADINMIETLQNKKIKLEGQLTGMNLIAKIKKANSIEINVKSAIAGTTIVAQNGTFQINEAVDILIPNVMEMQLIPNGIDIDQVKANITNIQNEIKIIFSKYNVNSLDELKEKSKTYHLAKIVLEKAELELKQVLKEQTWELIQEENAKVPNDIPTESEIQVEICELCGELPLDRYIGSLQTTLQNYKDKYQTFKNLQKTIKQLNETITKYQLKLTLINEVPEEFHCIDNPEQYDTDLQIMIKNYIEEIEQKEILLKQAEKQLKEKSAEEYSDELIEKRDIFEARKEEYKHWLHIQNIFKILKKQINENPMQDIEKKFREYLSVISNGGLELISIDERMTTKLISGKHALTYNILSDGTKDTISLAFRLAMLEHLYPEGNGLAIFDDPFTDMSPKRTIEACKLIEKFAQNNQVIFITCDEKYQKIMNGNIIQIIT